MEKRFDVTTIGESMVRLSVPAGSRIARTPSFDVQVSGAEANVVCALARLGLQCGWVSSLPDQALGHLVADTYHSHGVDLSAVIWKTQGRQGTFFVEFSAPPRPTKVIYDRENSCFSKLTCDEIDWDYVLDTRHLHISGLTVPLSAESKTIVEMAIRKAQENGIPVSLDINYRALLWSTDQAAQALIPLAEGIDLLCVSQSDARKIFRLSGDGRQIMERLISQTNAKKIVLTLAQEGLLGYDGSEVHHIRGRKVGMIDRIGAGDALVAGCLYGLNQGDFVLGLRAGAVMAALALSQHGDIVITNRRELLELLDNESTEIVR